MKFRGVLLGLRVIVFDVNQARELYRLGFYGKPLGIPKPKDAEFTAPLELGLIEAIYLAEKGLLSIVDEDERELSTKDIASHARRFIPKFDIIYKVYKELRDKGYIVRSGLKYGADFAVYEKGPGIDHAPYLVHVIEADEEIDPLGIVRAGRLSHSVRKAFILAITGSSETPTRYLMFKWSKP